MLRKIYILTFVLSFNITGLGIAQNLHADQSFYKSHSLDLAQADFRSTVNDAKSISWPNIIALESIILGYCYLSTFTWGAYFTGGSFGAGAAGLTGVLIFSDNSNPEITLPLAVGYSFISYYNFRFAESHTSKRKFWTNMVGIHTVTIGSFAIGKLLNKNNVDSEGLSIQPGLSSLKIVYNF